MSGYEMSKIDEYAEFVNEKTTEIAAFVDTMYIKYKKHLRTFLLKEIVKVINPIPAHYEWKPTNSYNYSGILEPDGNVDLNITIDQFLTQEYTGNKFPSYASGCKWIYETYGDKLQYDILNVTTSIMTYSIKKYLEKSFNATVTDEIIEELRDICNNFDEIDDESMTSDFFFFEAFTDFTEIGNIKLRDLCNVIPFPNMDN